MKITFTLVLFFAVGCGGNFKLHLNDEVRDSTDLEEFIGTIASTDEESVGDISLEDEFKTNEQNSNLQAPSDEKPEWVGELHGRVSSNKKGKKNLKNRPRATGADLVGESHEEVKNLQNEKVTNLQNEKVTNLQNEKVQNPQMHEEMEIVLDVPPPKVDILFVVDNSGSMNYVLRSIYDKMNGFTHPLEKLDWRVGFITASVKKGEHKSLMSLEYNDRLVINRKFLTKRTQYSEEILKDTLTRSKPPYLSSTLTRHRNEMCAYPPYCGGYKERPLGALKSFLLSPSQSFLRSSADLAVIILTDSFEKESKRDELVTTHSDVMEALRARSESKIMRVYSLSVESAVCRREIRQHQNFAEGHFSHLVEELVRETEGSKFSLCSSSYVPVAEQIAKDQWTPVVEL